MLLKIILDKGDVRVQISRDNKVIAEKKWEGDLSLSERLLDEIDQLLLVNNISKSNIFRTMAVYDEKSSVTSARIVQTVADAWNSAIDLNNFKK